MTSLSIKTEIPTHEDLLRILLLEWLANLRAGGWVQGRKCLFAPEKDAHCCLGVLHDLCRPQGPEPFAFLTSRDVGMDVLQRLAIGQARLAKMNDHDGKSFAEIADFLEARAIEVGLLSEDGGGQ